MVLERWMAVHLPHRHSQNAAVHEFHSRQHKATTALVTSSAHCTPFTYAETSQVTWCCRTLLHSSVAQCTIAITNAESCTKYTLGTAQPAQADAAAAVAEVAVAATRPKYIGAACSRKTHQNGKHSENTLCTSPRSPLSYQSGPFWQAGP